MKPTSLLRRLMLASVIGMSLGVAHAQNFPAKPVTLMVPYPAGGLSDVIARTINTALSKHLGQPVLVENLGGASAALPRKRSCQRLRMATTSSRAHPTN